jgi:hypothetical protein
MSYWSYFIDRMISEDLLVMDVLHKKSRRHIIALDVKQLLLPEKCHQKADAYLKWILISSLCTFLDSEPRTCSSVAKHKN